MQKYLVLISLSLFSIPSFSAVNCNVKSVVRCLCDASMMAECQGYPQAVYVANTAMASKAIFSLKTADGTETEIVVNNPKTTARALYSADPKSNLEVAAALKAKGKVLGGDDRLTLKSVELLKADDLYQDSKATEKAKTSLVKESAAFNSCAYISVVRKVQFEGAQKCAAFVKCPQATGTAICSLVDSQCPSADACANDQSTDAPEETVSKMLCFTLNANGKLDAKSGCSPEGTVATPKSSKSSSAGSLGTK